MIKIKKKLKIPKKRNLVLVLDLQGDKDIERARYIEIVYYKDRQTKSVRVWI